MARLKDVFIAAAALGALYTADCKPGDNPGGTPSFEVSQKTDIQVVEQATRNLGIASDIDEINRWGEMENRWQEIPFITKSDRETAQLKISETVTAMRQGKNQHFKNAMAVFDNNGVGVILVDSFNIHNQERAIGVSPSADERGGLRWRAAFSVTWLAQQKDPLMLALAIVDYSVWQQHALDIQRGLPRDLPAGDKFKKIEKETTLPEKKSKLRQKSMVKCMMLILLIWL